MTHRSLALVLFAFSCTKAEPSETPTGSEGGGGTKDAPAKSGPFAKGDEKAVRAALARARQDVGEACFEWPASFPRVVLVGSFAHDRGCDLEGMFVDRRWHDEGGTPKALATRDFANAKMEDKEAIARAWVEEGLQAFGGRFVQVTTKAFELEGSPKFEPVRARMNKIGGVVVEGWVQRPSGMQDETGFDFVVYRFAPDGAVETESSRGFAIDGQRLREAESAATGG